MDAPPGVVAHVEEDLAAVDGHQIGDSRLSHQPLALRVEIDQGEDREMGDRAQLG